MQTDSPIPDNILSLMQKYGNVNGYHRIRQHKGGAFIHLNDGSKAWYIAFHFIDTDIDGYIIALHNGQFQAMRRSHFPNDRPGAWEDNTFSSISDCIDFVAAHMHMSF